MTQTRQQAPERETVGRDPGFGAITVAVFVLSELLCVAVLVAVFL